MDNDNGRPFQLWLKEERGKSHPLIGFIMIKERTQSTEPGSFFLCPLHLEKRALLVCVELIGLYSIFNFFLTTALPLRAIIIDNFYFKKSTYAIFRIALVGSDKI